MFVGQLEDLTPGRGAARGPANATREHPRRGPAADGRKDAIPVASESGDKKQEQELLAATYVLTGARYSRELANKILKGALRNVFDVRESDTFQEIREIGLAEGIAEGQAKAERKTFRDAILRIGTRRFGAPSPEITERVLGTDDMARLNQLSDRLLETESWDEFWQE